MQVEEIAAVAGQRLDTAVIFLGSCVAVALSRGDGSRYTLRPHTTRMMTIFVLEGMRQLLNRLDGHFNIEAVLDTFEVKLSEAVMMLQENQAEIEAAVSSLAIS